MGIAYHHLAAEDLKILRETFKISEGKIGDYDRFLDGLKRGMIRFSSIIKDYAIGELSRDAITTIVKLHGYNYETVEDIVFMKKAKGHK